MLRGDLNGFDLESKSEKDQQQVERGKISELESECTLRSARAYAEDRSPEVLEEECLFLVLVRLISEDQS